MHGGQRQHAAAAATGRRGLDHTNMLNLVPQLSHSGPQCGDVLQLAWQYVHPWSQNMHAFDFVGRALTCAKSAKLALKRASGEHTVM